MALRLSPGAMTVLEKRYLKKDESGRVVESPEGMFRRVAENIAQAEALFGRPGDASSYGEAFYGLMSRLEFLPNSPTLMNAGRRLQQLAACFVIPVDDSLESIFKAVKNTALIHQSGGGTGFSFSRLRPADDIVSSTGGAASGPVSFMRVFNAATEAIKQGGTRRGANMGVLRVDHPDVIQFITVKEDPAEFRNFNLSVAVTDLFMRALDEGGSYELVNPRTGAPAGKLSASEVFGLIARSAWRSGEPGVLFIDRINRMNPTPRLGPFEATNPCGEQPLLPYEPCNLGSINLGKMVKDERGAWALDWEKLQNTVDLSVRFLDDVIEMSKYPTSEIDAMAKGNRKVGLGVMGFADLLVRLRLRYGSDESIAFARRLMRFISERAWEASRALARERGPFPNIMGSVFDKPGAAPVRNATVTTIAPTGTLSIIAACSSGIEPFFSLSYIRQVLNGVEIPEVNPLVAEVAKEEGFHNESLIEHVARGGDLRDRDEVPERIRDIFVAAYELPPEAHIKMQAAFQEYTDNAVSKTINLPPDASVEDVRAAYLAAWSLGCKGVTVYRSGTRAEQVLTCKSPLYC
ncbi:MAG: adenosylcobalamin-dependent ribonucleoside-diphosphate reductase [Thermodesulfobacteriota bacterium]|nr:MAG: adenosylcobalamin-dependent ribonucleoside-diphosphate reductase [Thermodesulfobacteriota bacterium]